MSSNMPLFWKIRSHISSFYLYKLGKYVFYFKAIIYIVFNFNHPVNSLKKIRNRNYPYTLEKKNLTCLEIKNKNNLYVVLKQINDTVKFDNNLMIINYNKKILKFKHHTSIELDIFTEKLYSKLSVKNKIVIDVGGNVGDSSLLYSALGAKKIIMIEPQPKFFEFAEENLKLNNEFVNIELINAGLSASNGYLSINYEHSADHFQFKEDQKNGVRIPKLTLEEILSNYNSSNFVLKLDCEGCEYDILLNSPDQILNKFDAILLEFHSGFKNISYRLQNLGFSVKILNSIYTPRKQYRGHLLAVK